MKEIVIDSLDGLKEVAEAVVESLNGRNVVAFCGTMGAGKTTLISAIMEHLGSNDTVTSPTFALVNQYGTAAGDAVYHFDFYRINRIEEVFDMVMRSTSTRAICALSSGLSLSRICCPKMLWWCVSKSSLQRSENSQ